MAIRRALLDAGHKGHDALAKHRLRVYAQGQKRGATPEIRRQFRRRAAVGPCIGHAKEEHRTGWNYLAHREGGAANAVLSAAGYNFRRLLRWLREFLRLLTAGGAGSLRESAAA